MGYPAGGDGISLLIMSKLLEILGFSVMRLLLVGVLILGLGTLVILGLLVMVRDLFCESRLEAPGVADEEAVREHTGQPPSASFSAKS
jgi:hypothetical protein